MGFFTPEQIEILSKTTVRCAFLSLFHFKSEDVGVWNGETDLETSVATFRPLRGSGQIDGLGFNGNAVSENITFSLPGVALENLDILQMAISETDETDGQIARVFLQLFDDEYQKIGDPIGLAWGFMQTPVVDRSSENGLEGSFQSVSIVAENFAYARATPPAGRLSDRDHQYRNPGDLMCQFITNLAAAGKLITYPDF